MKRIWDLQIGVTLSSYRIIQDVDLMLKALVIFYHENGAAVERLGDRNGHRSKEVGEGGSVGWGGTRTKGEGRECELTKNMFLHNYLLQFFLGKKRKITEFLPDTTVSND